MMASLLIILESHIIKKFVRQFLSDFIMYSNDEKTDMILIFDECCKNTVQSGSAHVYPQRYPNRPISKVFV
jgi:hypothetical protein